VKWDIFVRRRSKKKVLEDDPVGDVAEIIEKFAPKGYRSERDMFFYNYKIMQPYPKPLLAFLQTVSQRGRLESEPAAFKREVFVKLKDFYDPRDRLSLDEAVEDKGLIRKFREVFLFFYNKKDLSQEDIEELLKNT
jgi:hypothetical protein